MEAPCITTSPPYLPTYLYTTQVRFELRTFYISGISRLQKTHFFFPFTFTHERNKYVHTYIQPGIHFKWTETGEHVTLSADIEACHIASDKPTRNTWDDKKDFNIIYTLHIYTDRGTGAGNVERSCSSFSPLPSSAERTGSHEAEIQEGRKEIEQKNAFMPFGSIRTSEKPRLDSSWFDLMAAQHSKSITSCITFLRLEGGWITTLW